MATGPSRTADDLADNIRAVVDRLVDAELTKQVAQRGREIAATLAERAEEIGMLPPRPGRKALRRGAMPRSA